MPAYTLKLYRFAASSAVREDVRCVSFEAPADPAAVEHARRLCPERACDYWALLEDARLVRDEGRM